MKGNRLSMSKLGLAFICAYFARPDVHYAEAAPGRSARVGSLKHSLTEDRFYKKTRSYDDAAPDELADAIAMMRGPFGTWFDATNWTACEIGLRYDAENDVTEPGPRRGEPGYDDHGPMILKGTLDLVKDDEVLTVVDEKTGQPKNAHAEQLYGQAVAAARHYQRHTVRVGFVFPRKTKVIEPVWEELDSDRLAFEAGRIRRLLRTIPTAQPNPGDHCWLCPALRVCPAKQRRDDVPAPLEPALYDESMNLF